MLIEEWRLNIDSPVDFILIPVNENDMRGKSRKFWQIVCLVWKCWWKLILFFCSNFSSSSYKLKCRVNVVLSCNCPTNCTHFFLKKNNENNPFYLYQLYNQKKKTMNDLGSTTKAYKTKADLLILFCCLGTHTHSQIFKGKKKKHMLQAHTGSYRCLAWWF